jgi:hypothetical protein
LPGALLPELDKVDHFVILVFSSQIAIAVAKNLGWRHPERQKPESLFGVCCAWKHNASGPAHYRYDSKS